MDKIFIFTNENKLSALSIVYSEILADCSPYIKQQVFLLSRDSNSWEAKSNFKESGIYLVFDSLSDNLFNLLLTQSQNDTVYALIHNLPERANELYELKDHVIRKGHHESGDNIYSPVFDVLIDEEGDKMKRIIDILKPLDSEKLKETALRFFSGVSFPQNNSESFVNAKDILVQDADFGNAVSDFYENKYKVSQSYNDYFAEFKILVKTVTDIIIDRSRKEKLEKRNQ